jgi:hypothetical protein
MEFMWRVLRDLLDDIRRICCGFFVIIHYAWKRECIYSSLSLLTSDTNIVSKGKLTRYELVILNADSRSSWVTVLLDICWKQNPSHPSAHYGFFEKKLFLKSHAAQTIIAKYDWQSHAVFEMEGQEIPPDKIWTGNCDKKGWYRIQSILLDECRNTIEKLSICQELR